jgi:hypothetical protein
VVALDDSQVEADALRSAQSQDGYRHNQPEQNPEMEETDAMPYLPNKAPIPRQALRAHFDCPQRTLPNKLNALLGRLEGVERRQRVQAKLKLLDAGQRVKLDLPADVHWVPADQVSGAGPDWGGNQRHFESLRKAIEFVMQGLTIADRANVWITTEDGDLTIEQIEKLQ